MNDDEKVTLKKVIAKIMTIHDDNCYIDIYYKRRLILSFSVKVLDTIKECLTFGMLRLEVKKYFCNSITKTYSIHL